MKTIPYLLHWLAMPRFGFLKSVLAVMVFTLAGVSTTPGRSHEFWITPDRWSMAAGQTLQVALYVGTKFNGAQQLYQPDRISRFEVIGPGDTLAVKGRLGDRPAGRVTPVETGLHIIAHETTTITLRYDEFDDFASFTQNKGHEGAVARHLERRLPKSGFAEDYRRFAKSLIAVGSASGKDRVLGMEVEIIALDNPFTIENDMMSLQLRRDGRPWSGAKVTRFARPVGGRPDETRIDIAVADAKGQLTFTTRPGHLYLIDAVSLEETNPSRSDAGAVWSSRWASLTFVTP